ncbi:MAG: DUF1492 domain-containing protein [Eubacteriaceae bacterium]|nr:DUF1492 domain-containing protein [Eubacteriaceae bacterium]
MTSQERKQKVKWLIRYRILENQIARLEAEKERWKSRAMNTVPAAQHFKYYDKDKEKDQKTLINMTRQELRQNNMSPVIVHGSNSFSMGDIVVEMCSIEEEIQSKIDQAKSIRFEIGKAIDLVEDERLQLILYYKYVDGMYLEEICVKLKYSYRHVQRLHEEAIEKMSYNVI